MNITYVIRKNIKFCYFTFARWKTLEKMFNIKTHSSARSTWLYAKNLIIIMIYTWLFWMLFTQLSIFFLFVVCSLIFLTRFLFQSWTVTALTAFSHVPTTPHHSYNHTTPNTCIRELIYIKINSFIHTDHILSLNATQPYRNHNATTSDIAN